MSRPPLKKRFTQPVAKKEETNVLIDLSSIEQLSKQELFEKMRTTKAEYLVEKNKALFQDNLDLKQIFISAIRLQMKLLRDEFVSAGNAVLDSSLSLNTNSDDLQVLLQETENIAIRIINEIKDWENKIENLKTEGNSNQWVGFLQSETAQLSHSYPIINHYLIELENNYNNKLREIDSMVNNVISLSDRLKYTQEELEDCVELIEQKEKKIDRSQSKIVSDLLSDHHRKESTPTTPATPNNPENIISKESADIQQQLEEYKLMMEMRTREVNTFEKDIYILQHTLENVSRQVDHMSDERIRNSTYVHHLESSIDFHYGRIHYFENRIRELESEYDELKIAKKALRDQFYSEKTFQEGIWTTEIKHLQDNLNRYTTQRSNNKHSLNHQLAKESKFKEESTFIINEIENQKKRMIQLEKEIELKRKDDNFSIVLKEANMLKQILDQINKTHGIMHVLGQEKQSSIQIKETIQSLNQSFERLSNRHGDKINLLNDLFNQKEALLLMIEFFENTERLLYTQIDCDGRIYEGRQAIITTWINRKREQMMRIQAENIKYSQTFPALSNEANKIKKNIAHLKRISQQQADLIHSKENEEKDLVSQVTEQETIIRDLESKIEQCRLQVDDYIQESEEIGKRLKDYESQLLQLQNMAVEKVKALDHEISLGKQVSDDYEKRKKEWTMISNGENPASQELIDEVEDLRAKFKCGICKIRIRKCILQSCFHTFCNECIRTRLETRQRRCPSCAITFSASDVKDFYLYNT